MDRATRLFTHHREVKEGHARGRLQLTQRIAAGAFLPAEQDNFCLRKQLGAVVTYNLRITPGSNQSRRCDT